MVPARPARDDHGGDVLEVEARRVRWSRYRSRLALDDPSQPNFGTGGIPSPGDDPFLRLLILPSDPEVDVAEFDGEFWAWWSEEYEDPASGTRTYWGMSKRPSFLSALRGTSFREDKWQRYVALHRGIGLDMGLLADATYFKPDIKAHVFRLVPAIARIWSALELYEKVLNRYQGQGVGGPWEVTLALARTHGSLLGHVAKGWAEPGFAFDARRCEENALLHRLEVNGVWPNDEGRRQLAYRMGGWIEDSFGTELRRWIPNPDPGGQPLDRDGARWG